MSVNSLCTEDVGLQQTYFGRR